MGLYDALSVWPKQAYGQMVDGWATFVPNGNQFQTLTGVAGIDAFGVKTIERLAAGRWRVTLAEKCSGFFPQVAPIENDTTNLHVLQVESIDLANGQFTFVHRTAAFGSLGSLALSDTIDMIAVGYTGRRAF